MTNESHSWFLTGQTLDHRETVAALTSAIPDTIHDGFRDTELDPEVKHNVADDMAIELARAGYGLVKLAPVPHERVESPAPFLTRKED